MAEISAALVKELRDRTGAPIMDTKRALQETNGDMEAAIRVLREKGMAGAAKRSDRATPEETIEQEREIYASTDEVQSKPEQARDKIVEGMLNKRFFGASVLLDQEWIHDSGKKVGDVLSDERAEVLEFERFELSTG